MEDYKVGSLADLISGNNTPFKPEVVKKKFKLPEQNSPLKKKLKSNLGDVSEDLNAKKSKKKRHAEALENNEEGEATLNSLKKKKSKDSVGEKLNEEMEDKIQKKKKKKKFNSEELTEENVIIEDIKPKKKKKSKSDLGELNNQEFKEEKVNGDVSDKKKKKKREVIKDDVQVEELSQGSIKKKKKMQDDTSAEANAEYDESVSSQKEDEASKKIMEEELLPEQDNSDSDSSEGDDDQINVKPKKMSNAEKRIKAKEVKEKYAKKDIMHEMYQDRTIFVGNVNLKIKRKRLQKYFSKYGKVESVRIRSVSLSNVGTSKKLAAIKKQFHPNRNTANAYIRFQNSEDASKALVEDGKEFEGHHIRVDMAINRGKEERDENKAIFIGNLNFKSEEEHLWKLFSPYGEIASVRIIRDRATNMSKCFGYVNFVNSDTVSLVTSETFTLHDRQLRVNKCNLMHAKKEKRRSSILKQKERQRTKSEGGQNEEKGEIKKKTEIKNISPESIGDKTNGDNENQNFQGMKRAEKKKKRKINIGLQKKKAMAKKILPRSS